MKIYSNGNKYQDKIWDNTKKILKVNNCQGIWSSKKKVRVPGYFRWERPITKVPAISMVKYCKEKNWNQTISKTELYHHLDILRKGHHPRAMLMIFHNSLHNIISELLTIIFENTKLFPKKIMREQTWTLNHKEIKATGTPGISKTDLNRNKENTNHPHSRAHQKPTYHNVREDLFPSPPLQLLDPWKCKTTSETTASTSHSTKLGKNKEKGNSNLLLHITWKNHIPHGHTHNKLS